MSPSENEKTKIKLKAHKKMIKDLSGRLVEAGWFESARYEGEASGKGEKGKGGRKRVGDEIGLPVAQIAYWNEFGTVRIPARPFMRLAFENFNRKRGEIQGRIIKRLIESKITVDQALAQIGLAMEGEIVDAIKNGNWTPNSSATVAIKGFDKPLIDTAQMWKTVASKVT